MATVGGRSVPTDEAVIGWRCMLHGVHAFSAGMWIAGAAVPCAPHRWVAERGALKIRCRPRLPSACRSTGSQGRRGHTVNASALDGPTAARSAVNVCSQLRHPVRAHVSRSSSARRSLTGECTGCVSYNRALANATVLRCATERRDHRADLPLHCLRRSHDARGHLNDGSFPTHAHRHTSLLKTISAAHDSKRGREPAVVTPETDPVAAHAAGPRRSRKDR